MTSDFNDELVRRMAALLDETGLGEIEYETKDLKIRIARPAVQMTAMAGPAPVPSAVAAPATAPAPAAETGEAVPSPMVGTAYLAAEPGSAPFVQPGSKVAKGATLLISRGGQMTFWQWLKRAYGFADDQVRPYTFNPGPFLANPDWAQQGYVTSEPYAIERAGGFTPRVFLLADHGY